MMSDGSVQNRFETTANGAWSGWNLFAPSQTARALTVGVHADGRLELFAVTPTGADVEQARDGAERSVVGLERVRDAGGVTETLSTAGHADGRMAVFAVMSDGSMRSRSETVPNGPWSEWDVYGPTGGANGYGIPGTVTAAAHQDGRVEVFAVTPAGAIRNRFETAPGAAWSGWGEGFGPAGPVTAASVTRHADGRMEVFAVLADGSVWNRFEAVANGRVVRVERVRRGGDCEALIHG